MHTETDCGEEGIDVSLSTSISPAMQTSPDKSSSSYNDAEDLYAINGSASCTTSKGNNRDSKMSLLSTSSNLISRSSSNQSAAAADTMTPAAETSFSSPNSLSNVTNKTIRTEFANFDIDHSDSPYDEANADSIVAHYSSNLFSSSEQRETQEDSPVLMPSAVDAEKNSSDENGSKTNYNPVSIRSSSRQLISDNDYKSNNDNDSTSLSYYTTEPNTPYPLLSKLFYWSPLSFHQYLREYRHNTCIMTPISALVLFAILLSSLVGLIFSVPQFALGLLLGPLLKRNMWMVEFLYRYGIARWGHVKIMSMGAKSRNRRDATGTGTSAADQRREMMSPSSSHHGEPPDAVQKKLERLGIAGHSQTIHQRITVVPDRVFIHPIPQFMDNVAYLIVCCPPRKLSGGGTALSVTGHESVDNGYETPVIGVLVDCGEANVILGYLECIYEQYYSLYPRSNAFVTPSTRMGIALHSILCTHRHHDHTAGVGELVEHLESIRHDFKKKTAVVVHGGVGVSDRQKNLFDRVVGNVVVVGAAMERVPHQTLFVKNGCFIPLPCIEDNDMNKFVSIEVINVPSHTRGSVVYALRNRVAPEIALTLSESTEAMGPLQCHLFTGDAIFSGGGGVPFESDLERASDNFIKNPKSLQSKNGSSKIRPGAGALSMERCFAEVLARVDGPWSSETARNSIYSMIYPGHEYTTDLIMRQFDQKNIPGDLRWVHLPPSTFFEAASHYYVSAHRRALAQKSKLLTIPLPLQKEQIFNPTFRSLKRRGEQLINALLLWYEFGARSLIPDLSETKHADKTFSARNFVQTQSHMESLEEQSVFTTIYTNDLEVILQEMRSGKLGPAVAADKLESLHFRLNERAIGRRPIPNTLPSHKNVYLGVLALIVLGSAPSAVTVSDAVVMNMAEPVDNTDHIMISKKRLVASLHALNLTIDDFSIQLEDIIDLLWKEAKSGSGHDIQRSDDKNDVESDSNEVDIVELGWLKLTLFGVTLNQRSKFCLPCGNPRPAYAEESWVVSSKLKRAKGELVRHDAEKCLLCRDVFMPCPYVERNISVAF